MDTRIAEIERLMQDKTLSLAAQQLLDQELDALLRMMDELQQMEDNRSCERCSGCVYCMPDEM